MKAVSKIIALLAVLGLVMGLAGSSLAADKAKDAAAAVAKKAPAAAMKAININKASAKELAQLKGVGDKLAAKIVEYRTKHGAFKSVQDLTKVKGIGPKILENNKGLIVLK